MGSYKYLLLVTDESFIFEKCITKTVGAGVGWVCN